MPERPNHHFPKSFLWGVSTSAHQTEGGNHNQWSVWELENAKALAAQSGYQYGDLPSWKQNKKLAKNPASYVSAKAADHYHLYEQDFLLAKKMGLNSWRFSIEWSRVQPEQGAWNVEEIQHYKRYLAALTKAGLEPVVTLFHVTLPVWFAAAGGFEKRGNVQYFLDFVDRIMDEIGASVRYVITLNEPDIYVLQSYAEGRWPPQAMSRARSLKVTRNLIYAHNRAADLIHAKNRRFKVSIAKNYPYIYPGDDALVTRRAARLDQYMRNDYWLNHVAARCDFIGINYYCSDRYYGYRIHNPNDRLSDLGFDLQPSDIELVILDVHEKYKLPVLITENGLADANDEHRKWWLAETILAMQRAITAGAELIGYMHWSFMDNFEWDKGVWPRFGLFEVDYQMFKRTPRPSALWYAKIIKKIRG